MSGKVFFGGDYSSVIYFFYKKPNNLKLIPDEVFQNFLKKKKNFFSFFCIGRRGGVKSDWWKNRVLFRNEAKKICNAMYWSCFNKLIQCCHVEYTEEEVFFYQYLQAGSGVVTCIHYNCPKKNCWWKSSINIWT